MRYLNTVRNCVLAVTALLLTACATSHTTLITTKTPARPAGQQSVLRLTTAPLSTVRVGFIGLGMRGPGAVNRWCNIEGTDIKALCDVEKARVEASQKILANNGRPAATGYWGDTEAYKAMCERDDIDLIYIATDWVHHVPIALYAMEHGKHVAIEVPAANTLDEIWALVNTAERTRRHCIMLENCVYDFFEMSALHMAQEGLFGEVLHAEGAYLHNLEDFWDAYWNNWREDYNQKHRGDVYPTHGLGPDCQVLNIHRGDRMDYLVSMDTKSMNGKRLAVRKTGRQDADFANGDQTSTMIHTVKGKTILLQHNVLTPRPYSRMFQIVGTDGYASKYPIEQLLLRQEKGPKSIDFEKLDAHECLPDSMCQALLTQYLPDFVKEIEEKARKVGGHGGMDYIMDYRLVYCLRNGLPLDMDVYDLAEWCCISELSRISLSNNSAPVAIPDFTRGEWEKTAGFRYELR